MFSLCAKQDPIKEEDVMNSLADKKTLYESLSLAKVLSRKGTNSLGDWEIRWQYDPRATEIEKMYVYIRFDS